jgi:hypothetical protein
LWCTGGARYTRHIDNSIGNGRKLTVIYYPNSRNWVARKADSNSKKTQQPGSETATQIGGAGGGGALRLFPPSHTTPSVTPPPPPPPPLLPSSSSSSPLPSGSDFVDVSPTGDRLVLFFSDSRVPHEVLPTLSSQRFAVTAWFFDAIEKGAAAAAASAAAAPPPIVTDSAHIPSTRNDNRLPPQVQASYGSPDRIETEFESLD